MLPAVLTAKAIQLCAAGLGAAVTTPAPPYAIIVHTGASLTRQPDNEADAEATVRDLLALGADFDAGPLAIKGQTSRHTASLRHPCSTRARWRRSMMVRNGPPSPPRLRYRG
jgi:hypothetical protein